MKAIDSIGTYDIYRSPLQTLKNPVSIKDTAPSSNKRLSVVDKVDIAAAAKTHSYSFGDKGNLSVTFNEKCGNVNALHTSCDGNIQEIKQEDLPAVIRHIKDAKALGAYLQKSHMQITTCSNNDVKLYSNPSLKGGVDQNA